MSSGTHAAPVPAAGRFVSDEQRAAYELATVDAGEAEMAWIRRDADIRGWRSADEDPPLRRRRSRWGRMRLWRSRSSSSGTRAG